MLWWNKLTFESAIVAGNVEKIKAVLGHAPELIIKRFGAEEETVLGLAASYRQQAVVQLILERHANVKARDGSGLGAIHWAAVTDVTEILRMLVDAGEHVNAPDRYRAIPLHFAAEIGSMQMVEHLIELGADATLVDRFGASPIHYLIEGNAFATQLPGGDYGLFGTRWIAGALPILRLLVSRGCDVNAQAKFRTSPLNAAAARGLGNLVDVLPTCGAVETKEKDSDAVGFKEIYGRVDDWREPKELAAARKSQIVSMLCMIMKQGRRQGLH